MKLFLMLVLAVSMSAAPIAELKLKDGRVLRQVDFKSFASESVMAKYTGGAGTIRYDLLPDDVLAAVKDRIPAPKTAEPVKELPDSYVHITTLPSEITISSGRILSGITVSKWSEAGVVVRFPAGDTELIPFSLIQSIARADLIAMRDAGMVEQRRAEKIIGETARLKQETEAAKVELQVSLDKIADAKSISPGMSKAQVERAWGKPSKINSSGGAGTRHEQWVYRETDSYVYFDDGIMTFWQKSS